MRERGGRFAQEKRNDPGPEKVLNLTSLELSQSWPLTCMALQHTTTYYNTLQHSKHTTAQKERKRMLVNNSREKMAKMHFCYG